MLVEPPNEWEGSLLPSRLHGSITLIARLVDSTFSLRPFSTVESHSAYLSVIFSGGAQIHEHLHVAFDWFPGLQSCKNRSKERKTCVRTLTIVIFHEVLVKYRIRLHNVLRGKRPDGCPVRVEQL